MPEENEALRSDERLTEAEWKSLIADRDKLSPMMRQYFTIKDQHKGYILLFRLGDFYEMFFEDALTVSPGAGTDPHRQELRPAGARAPMCGIPHQAADSYIQRLVDKGYKVAICEQVESPYLAKGVVKREVIRITTPGTVIESAMLPEGGEQLYRLRLPDRQGGRGLFRRYFDRRDAVCRIFRPRSRPQADRRAFPLLPPGADRQPRLLRRAVGGELYRAAAELCPGRLGGGPVPGRGVCGGSCCGNFTPPACPNWGWKGWGSPAKRPGACWPTSPRPRWAASNGSPP